MNKPVALACDAAGLDLKNEIKKHLEERGIACEDVGTYTGESCDYPDYAKLGCEAVLSGRCEVALLFCGTGVGMSIAANKIHGIRACCCSDVFSAELTRRHNNANALCLGGRVVGPGLAAKLVDAFLDAPYEGGRHQRRIDKITELEAAR
ncbi:MAG: ribose 5-phosphate isomerase B [Oscillospiraceae bacterium]